MKVGDKVKLTTMVYGEAIFDRKGKPVDMPGYKSTYIGVIEYIGPECSFPSAEVVRCSGGDIALKLNNGFSFYPQDNGREQIVKVLI